MLLLTQGHRTSKLAEPGLEPRVGFIHYKDMKQDIKHTTSKK